VSYRIVVLLSGNGSTLQSLIDTIAEKGWPVTIAAVVSDKADAYGLTRAKEAGIPTEFIDRKAYPSREAFDEALVDVIRSYEAELIVLAGFMRILTAKFTQAFAGQVINIHPSLLPKYRGLDTYAQALAAGDAEHGSSVHFVTETLDGGPMIAQVRFAIVPGDNVDTLSAFTKQQERVLYPKIVHWFAQGRLQMVDNGVKLDGLLLAADGIQFYTPR